MLEGCPAAAAAVMVKAVVNCSIGSTPIAMRPIDTDKAAIAAVGRQAPNTCVDGLLVPRGEHRPVRPAEEARRRRPARRLVVIHAAHSQHPTTHHVLELAERMSTEEDDADVVRD